MSFNIFFCFLDIKREISATVLECIAKIRPCYRSASATFLERPWSNYTALNAWTSTLPSLQDTITLMGHISALVSHTCFLWCIQNIGKLEIEILGIYTDKETDESWDIFIIYNMKNQFWAVGWAGL